MVNYISEDLFDKLDTEYCMRSYEEGYRSLVQKVGRRDDRNLFKNQVVQDIKQVLESLLKDLFYHILTPKEHPLQR